MSDLVLAALKRLCDEFEALERQIHSQKIRLPEEWFWHGEFVKAIRHLYIAIVNEVEKLEGYERQRIITDSDIRNLTEHLEILLDRLNKKLKPIEKESFFYMAEQAKEINSSLNTVEFYLIRLLQRFKVLETHYVSDLFMQKKKILIDLGLNVFKYPEITRMILHDWSIIEEMLKILPQKDCDSSIKVHHVWSTLPLFYDLIFLKLPESEIESIRNTVTIKPYQKPEEIYQNPYFIDELKEFQHLVSLRKAKLYIEGIATLKKTILLLSMIVYGGTVGEHLGRWVAGKYIPNLRKIIRNRNDIDTLFQQFTIELAQKCNTTVADSGHTSTLVGESWYAGTLIRAFQLQHS